MKSLDESTQETKDILAELAKEAEAITLETLPAFITKLTTEYEHDYGTIIHAIALGAIAGAWAVERSGKGGITGFQASCLEWQFLIYWNPYKYKDKAVSMIEWGNLLYPQYDYRIHTITKKTFEWLQKEAIKKLHECRNQEVHPTIKARWEQIASGIVPAGLTIRDASE